MWSRRLGPRTRIAVPAFICRELVDTLARANPVVLYPLNERLEPDLPWLEARLDGREMDAIILVDHFGAATSDPAVQDRLAARVPVLIDRAHCLPPQAQPARTGVAVVYSFRKVMPYAFGGLAAWLYDLARGGAGAATGRAPARGWIKWGRAMVRQALPKPLRYHRGGAIEPNTAADHLQPGWVTRLNWSWVRRRITDFRGRLEDAARAEGATMHPVGTGAPTYAVPFRVRAAPAALAALHGAGIHAFLWPDLPDGPECAALAQARAFTATTVMVPLLHSRRLHPATARTIARILAAHAV